VKSDGATALIDQPDVDRSCSGDLVVDIGEEQ
jgi:hypothetical protein